MRAANGTTIQVIHTDAEGRMVLADTLALAGRTRPRLIIDFATLTGACVYALTERMSGVFTNEPHLAHTLIAAGAQSGERVWGFPFDADYDSDLDSKVADIMQCAPEAKGDHILAARFLSRFVPRRHAVGPCGPVRRRAQRRPRAHSHRHDRIRRTVCARADPETERVARAGAARLSTLTLRRPDDWHLHLRDGAALRAVLPFTRQRFARAIVMPNLKPPITTTELALAYYAPHLAPRGRPDRRSSR